VCTCIKEKRKIPKNKTIKYLQRYLDISIQKIKLNKVKKWYYNVLNYACGESHLLTQ
jgi:hypothetical protein